MKCHIHKEETKVFIYTKKSSKTANKKVDVGKQCETCLVGILNSMNNPETFRFSKKFIQKKIDELRGRRQESAGIPVKYLKGLDVGPMISTEITDLSCSNCGVGVLDDSLCDDCKDEMDGVHR